MLRHLSLLAVLCISGAACTCPAGLRNYLNQNLKTNVENGCEADWKFFDRPSGGWCMKVFASDKLFVAAEKECKANGATLSGIQNAAEVDFIQDMTLASISVASGSVLIGARRTAKCTGQGLSATCSPTTAFQWTDGSATGTDGFVFMKGQPDNSKGNQNCALLLASSTPTVTTNTAYPAKTLDDVPCDLVAGTGPRAAVAFVCGKKASK